MSKIANLYYWNPSLGEYKEVDSYIPLTIDGDYGYAKCLILANQKKIKNVNISNASGQKVYFSYKNEDPKMWTSFFDDYFIHPSPVVYFWLRADKRDSYADENKNLYINAEDLTINFTDDTNILEYDVFGVCNTTSPDIADVPGLPFLVVDNEIFISNISSILKSLNHGSWFSGDPDSTNGYGYLLSGTTPIIKKFFDQGNDYIYFAYNTASAGKIAQLNKNLTNESELYTDTKLFADLFSFDDTRIALFVSDGIYVATGDYNFTISSSQGSIAADAKITGSISGEFLRVWADLDQRTGWYSDDYALTWNSFNSNFNLKSAPIYAPGLGVLYLGNYTINAIADDNTETILFSDPTVDFHHIAYGYNTIAAFCTDRFAPTEAYLIMYYEEEWYKIPLKTVLGLSGSDQANIAIASPNQLFFTNDRHLLLTIDGYFLKLPIDNLFDIKGTIKPTLAWYTFDSATYAQASSALSNPATNTTEFEFGAYVVIDTAASGDIIYSSGTGFIPRLQINGSNVVTASVGGMSAATAALTTGKAYLLRFYYDGSDLNISANDVVVSNAYATYTNTGASTINMGGSTNAFQGKILFAYYILDGALINLWKFDRLQEKHSDPIVLDYQGRIDLTIS